MIDVRAGRQDPSPWWVATICGMASFIDAIAVVAAGSALVLYQQALRLTNSQFGVMSSILQLSIAVGAVVGGRLGDTYGRRKIFSITMVAIIVAMVILVASSNWLVLCVALALAGLGIGGDLPVSLATVGEYASEENRGKLVGLSQVLWTAGLMAGAGVAAVFGAYGYTGGRIIFGVVGAVAVLVFLGRLTVAESRDWLDARERRQAGLGVEEDRIGVASLFSREYRRPFLALLVFYSLINIGFYVNAQFGTWVNVNVIHLSVRESSIITGTMFVLGIIANLAFLRVVDTRWRMSAFYAGAVMIVFSYAVYTIFGFSVVTLVLFQGLLNIGCGFASEGIMKVWTQESFPTLMRSTAQGSILFVARIAASIVALFTANLIALSPRGSFAGLSLVALIGMVVVVAGLGSRARGAVRDR